MQITIDIPDNIYNKIISREDISQTAKEMLAKHYYYERLISLDDATELSGLPYHAFLHKGSNRTNWMVKYRILLEAQKNKQHIQDGYKDFKTWLKEVKGVNPNYFYNVTTVYKVFGNSSVLSVLPLNRLIFMASHLKGTNDKKVLARFAKFGMLNIKESAISAREFTEMKSNDFKKVIYDIVKNQGRKKTYNLMTLLDIMQEAEKTGNIRGVCRKHGISKDTFYRFKKR